MVGGVTSGVTEWRDKHLKNIFEQRREHAACLFFTHGQTWCEIYAVTFLPAGRGDAGQAGHFDIVVFEPDDGHGKTLLCLLRQVGV